MERAEKEMTPLRDDEVHHTVEDEQEIEHTTSCTSLDPSPQVPREQYDSPEYVKLHTLSLHENIHIHHKQIYIRL